MGLFKTLFGPSRDDIWNAVRAQIDDAFVIKGNDETLVKRLCGSARLRELVAAQPSFRIGVRDDDGLFGTRYPADVDVLVFEVAERIRDVARLRGLYEVFAEALDGLAKIGVTSRNAPRT